MVQRVGIFRSAVTEADGKTIDVGYLSLYWLMCLDIFLSLVVVSTGFFVQYYYVCPEMLVAPTVPGVIICHEHTYPFTDVAAALGAIWMTFSTALGALGLFRRGDITR